MVDNIYNVIQYIIYSFWELYTVRVCRYHAFALWLSICIRPFKDPPVFIRNPNLGILVTIDFSPSVTIILTMKYHNKCFRLSIILIIFYQMTSFEMAKRMAHWVLVREKSECGSLEIIIVLSFQMKKNIKNIFRLTVSNIQVSLCFFYVLKTHCRIQKEFSLSYVFSKYYVDNQGNTPPLKIPLISLWHWVARRPYKVLSVISTSIAW